MTNARKRQNRHIGSIKFAWHQTPRLSKISAVNLSTLANIATALTVLTAVVFGLIEMRHARREREERAAFVAVQAILTPAWTESMTLVQAISEGTTPAQIEADPRLFQAVQSLACILESLGYAVFARMVPLNVVDELLGGTVRVTWRKLRGYVEYERERAGSQKNWECVRRPLQSLRI
jgi:hypothetical protein